MDYKSDSPVYQESYSRAPAPLVRLESAPITLRIAETIAPVEASPLTPFLIGLVLAGACFVGGWYARGLFGVVWDNRGWAALLVLAVIGAPCAVAYCNRIAERTA